MGIRLTQVCCFRTVPLMTARDQVGQKHRSTPGAIPRRAALKWLMGAVAAPVLLAEAAQASPIWKTAIGLNGFQSGSRKYKKNYPIWEVLDFASRNSFEGVELVADWPAGGYPASADTERARALRRLYDAYGLRIFSIQLGASGA